MYLDNKYHVIMERQAVDILNHMLDNIYHVMMERQAVDIINHMLDTVVIFFLSFYHKTFSVKSMMNFNNTYTCTLQVILVHVVYLHVYFGQIDISCKHVNCIRS